MQLPRLNWPSRALGVVVTVGVVWGCGDKGGTTTSTPTPVATKISLSATAVPLDGLGATQQLTATVNDQNGAAMTSATVSWASDAAGVATVSAGLVTAVAKGTANVTATSGSLSATAAVTVTQTPTTMAKVSGDGQAATVGAALTNPLVVLVSDVKSQPIAGVAVAFAVTGGGGSVGTAAATTGADGKAQSIWTIGTSAAAAQVATATVTGLTAAGFTATGTADVPSIIAVVSGNNQTGLVSAALTSPVVVKVTDQYNNPLLARTVTFAVTGGGGSLNPTSTSTTANGQAQTTWTLGPGTGAQSMTASSLGTGGAGLTGSPLAIGATGSTLGITSIVQDTLIEGASITINGSGFSATPASNTVLIDGAAATVTVASATQLTVTVPAFDCKPARDGNTTVGVSGATSNAVSKRIHPASFITATTVGTQQIIQTPATFCLQFRPNTVGGDAYLVGVGMASDAGTAASTGNAVTISTGTGAASAPFMPAPTAVPLFSNRQGAATARPETPLEAASRESWMRTYQGEAKLRAWEERNLFSRSGAPLMAPAPRTPQSPAAVASVGDIISVTVVDFTQASSCLNAFAVSAKVKAVGAAGIWATDITNPPADSLLDATIQAYSDTFDTKIFAGDTTNFGAPSDIDGNQRVVIIMTKQVNKNGVAGFVFSGDLFSKGSCAASNVGEYFYGEVPDSLNTLGLPASSVQKRSTVFNQLPSLIAHEFTHDIQNSRRLLAAGGTNMAAWEAEGQAMLAQELVGNLVLGTSSGTNNNFATLMGVQTKRWDRQAFDLLGSYFGFQYTANGKNLNTPDQCSLYASTSTANIACFNFAFYGASWSFQRYLMDRFAASYPGGPTKFTHDVIGKNVNLAGRAAWESLLGVTSLGFDSLFAQWGAMLYVDDRVGAATAAQQMTSWNVFDILTNFGSNYQLTVTARTFTAFSDAHTVNGGSTTYTTLSSGGPHPALAVKVRDGSGAVLASTARPVLWVTRIQ